MTGTSAPSKNTAALPPQGALHLPTQSSRPAEAAAECVSFSLTSCSAPRQRSSRAAPCFQTRSASAARSCCPSSSAGRWAAWPITRWGSHTLGRDVAELVGEEVPGEEAPYWVTCEPLRGRSGGSLPPGCRRCAALKLHYKRHCRCSGLRWSSAPWGRSFCDVFCSCWASYRSGRLKQQQLVMNTSLCCPLAGRSPRRRARQWGRHTGLRGWWWGTDIWPPCSWGRAALSVGEEGPGAVASRERSAQWGLAGWQTNCKGLLLAQQVEEGAGPGGWWYWRLLWRPWYCSRQRSRCTAHSGPAGPR